MLIVHTFMESCPFFIVHLNISDYPKTAGLKRVPAHSYKTYTLVLTNEEQVKNSSKGT